MLLRLTKKHGHTLLHRPQIRVCEKKRRDQPHRASRSLIPPKRRLPFGVLASKTRSHNIKYHARIYSIVILCIVREIYFDRHEPDTRWRIVLAWLWSFARLLYKHGGGFVRFEHTGALTFRTHRARISCFFPRVLCTDPRSTTAQTRSALERKSSLRVRLVGSTLEQLARVLANARARISKTCVRLCVCAA